MSSLIAYPGDWIIFYRGGGYTLGKVIRITTNEYYGWGNGDDRCVKARVVIDNHPGYTELCVSQDCERLEVEQWRPTGQTKKQAAAEAMANGNRELRRYAQRLLGRDML